MQKPREFTIAIFQFHILVMFLGSHGSEKNMPKENKSFSFKKTTAKFSNTSGENEEDRGFRRPSAVAYHANAAHAPTPDRPRVGHEAAK